MWKAEKQIVIVVDRNWTLQNKTSEGDLCNICQCEARKPVSLQCQHKFCRQCLKDKVGFELRLIYKGTIKCPVCKGEHHTSVPGVHCFHRCFPIDASTKESARVTYMKSEQHPSKHLELFCCECKLDICKICSEEFHRNHLVEGLPDCETRENLFLEKEKEFILANRSYLPQAKTVLDFKRSRIHHFKHAALEDLSKQAERLKEVIDAAVRTQESAIKEHFRTYEEEVRQDNILIEEKSESLTLAEEYLSQMQEYKADLDIFEEYKKQKETVSLEFTSFRQDYDKDLEESFQIGQIQKEQVKSMLGSIKTPVSSRCNDKTLSASENAGDVHIVPRKGFMEAHSIFRNWGDFVRQVSA